MSVVYAISSGDAIKFGVSDGSVHSRLDSMQVGNAKILEILVEYQCESPFEIESALFDWLVEYRIRGEWYFPAVAVLELIEIMRSGDLVNFLQRDTEDSRPRKWFSLIKQAEERRKYMRNYMRRRREA